MGVTNSGKSGLALLLTVSGVRPDVISIGTGSSTFSVTQSGLTTLSNSASFTSTDISVPQKVTFTGDWSSTTISGTILTEFGIQKSGLTNAVWNRETMGSIVFDGTNELEIQETVEVF